MKTLLSGTVALVILAAGAGPTIADTIPAPTRTIPVLNSAQLNAALAAAVAGDHIVLANGNYAGFTVERSGSGDAPIVIWAANTLAAKITGDVYIKGNAVWLVGANLGNKHVYIEGADDRLSSSYSSGASFPIAVSAKARRAEIDHNEIDNKNLGGIATADRAGLRMDYTASVDDFTYAHHVHHNHFRNTSRGTVNEPDNNAIASARANTDIRTGVVIEYNLVANWYGGRCIYTKSHANTIRYNTCVDGNEAVYNRTGNENLWSANWIENISALILYGKDNRAIGNRLTNGAITVMMGTCSSLTHTFCSGPPRQEAAANTFLAGNIGKLVIGKRPSVTNGVPATFPAVNTRVEAHVTGNGCGQGTITCGTHQGTVFSATTSEPIRQAFKLTPDQVGPHAPTAPGI